MAPHRHVVGRIGEHHARALPVQNAIVARVLQGITAEEAVRPEDPEIARAGHRRPRPIRVLDGLGGGGIGRAGGADEDVDLGQLEADDVEIEVQLAPEAQVHQLGKLDLQVLRVPLREFRQPVVGDAQRPHLGRAQVVGHHRRNRGEPQRRGGLDAAMAGDDHALAIDQDRGDEAELRDGGLQPVDGPGSVDTVVVGVRLQPRDRGLDHLFGHPDRVARCPGIGSFGLGTHWRLHSSGPLESGRGRNGSHRENRREHVQQLPGPKDPVNCPFECSLRKRTLPVSAAKRSSPPPGFTRTVAGKAGHIRSPCKPFGSTMDR